MESDEDNHLCLRCGQTIIGLDNYVSHRQQKCFKINNITKYPFLSEGSDILTSSNSNIKDLQEPSFSDIYKLSADDFFLSLNLQSISNSGNGTQRSINNINESFCSKLGFPSLENDLESPFSDKEFIQETIISVNSASNIDRLILSSDNSFSTQDSLSCSDSTGMFSKTMSNMCLVASGKSTPSNEKSSAKILSKKLLQKQTHLNQKQRVSLRQAENTNLNYLCCAYKEERFTCTICNFKCIFSSTFLSHLNSCNTKNSDINERSDQIFKTKILVTKNSNFSCELCSFYSNESPAFLNHLKSKTHCQTAAKLKNPLLCFPCCDELSSCDEMKNHFLKTHTIAPDMLHPVVIKEKKKNIHCCYCFTIIHKSNIATLKIRSSEINSEDIKLIIDSVKEVTHCAFGIEKNVFNSYLKSVKSLSDSQNEESKDLDVHFFNSSDNNEESKRMNNDEADGSDFIGKLTALTKVRKKSFTTKKTKLLFCSHCNTEHKDKILFKKHLKLHTGKKVTLERKYLCEKCGFVCNSFHGMTKHERHHTGKKPFKCSFCNLSFPVCSALSRHRRIHTGIKPYNCPYCSYACNTQENLRKHILKTKKHAGRKMYPCKYCNFESNEFLDYKSHLVKLHSEQCVDYQNIKSLDKSNKS